MGKIENIKTILVSKLSNFNIVKFKCIIPIFNKTLKTIARSLSLFLLPDVTNKKRAEAL